MNSSTASVFFAILSLACWAGVVVVAFLALVRRFRGSAGLDALFADLGAAAPWLAGLVAVVATLGSLYYSEIAHFVPCELCWYQRICMYPMSVLLVVAAARRDRGVWWYAIPLAGVGTVISVYHTQLQAFPTQGSFCPTLTPCTTRYVWEFGFVSLPFMALSGFVFILTMAALTRGAIDRASRYAPDEDAGRSGNAGSGDLAPE